MVSLFGRGFDSLQLHKTHCNGGEFFVFNPLQTLFKPPSTPLKPHQISPDLGLKREFLGHLRGKTGELRRLGFL